MKAMRTLRNIVVVALIAAIAFAPGTLVAQQVAAIVQLKPADSIAAFASAVNGSTAATPCALIKYVGSTTGKPTVAVAAGGDMTLSIAGSADTTTGWTTAPTNNGVFDLSTPDTTINTMGKLVNIVNTTGNNWRMVLVGCLASDNTDNTIDTLATTDAASPQGVALFKDSVVASSGANFSAQVALYPQDKATDIRFFLSGGPTGNTTGSTKVNPNPLCAQVNINGQTTACYQPFVQHFREKITSTGTVGLLEVLGVKRTYDSTGKVAETVRTLYSETGAATTVEKVVNVHNGPIPGAPGEIIVIRQRTGTDLTAINIAGSGYMTRQ